LTLALKGATSTPMPFTVAIIGRPNVGKSTLFNRLVGKRLALVDDQPGVTRDRREGDARLGDLKFRIIDTAGLEDAPEEALEGRMRQQTERAIEEADLCLFLIDVRSGLTPDDHHFGAMLRESGKPVLVLANKMEGMQGSEAMWDAYGLGLGDPIPTSGEHGEGMADLYQAIRPFHDAYQGEVEADESLEWDDPLKPLRIAVVGRPNAGKSTLINHLLGEQRLLTGPEAGITRDSIAVEWSWQDKTRDRVWPVKLFDTAGLRKRARIQEKLEKLSVSDSVRAIRFAEIVALMIDAENPMEKQDLQIADLALREGRALVILANKWDLIKDKDQAFRHLREKVERLLPQAPGIPIIQISALTGRGVEKIMPAITDVYMDWNARVKTADLNQWMKMAQEKHPPPAVAGRRIRIKYIAQTKTRPPTFVAHCQRADDLPESYRRYLINGLREAFDIPAVPIRLQMKKQDNPYADEKKR